MTKLHSLTLLSCCVLLLVQGARLNAEERHFSSSEATRAAIAKPQPLYPAMARQLRLQGQVELEAIIEEDGSVREVKIVSGNAVLTAAAVAACKNWKFPPMISGKATAAISFTFKM